MYYTKMDLVHWLADNGYHFYGERLTHFANRFSKEELEMFVVGFANRKGLVNLLMAKPQTHNESEELEGDPVICSEFGEI